MNQNTLDFDKPGSGADEERGDNRPCFSVSEISRQIKTEMEESFPYVRVRGEVSQPKRATSGHVYFRLKDEKAVLDAVAWRGVASRLALQPEEGLEVIASGRITTYPGRSSYQLILEELELAGEGALLKLLEERRKALAGEGLFDEARKKNLPYLPELIGLITSPTGAVIQDMRHRLQARFPTRLLLWPVAVQGEKAPQEVARAIAGFNTLPEEGWPRRPDLLIVARGGGSLEDLWAFNEELVVRAAAKSEIPLISAIGHETDQSLLDWVADKRAPTPTAAAEIAVPVRSELMDGLGDFSSRLHRSLERRWRQANQELGFLSRPLDHPERILEGAAQTLDEAAERLVLALRRAHRQGLADYHNWANRLPEVVLRFWRDQAKRLAILEPAKRADRAVENYFSRKAESLAQLFARMRASQQSEEQIMQRGYARVHAGDDKIIPSAKAARREEALELEFADGRLSVKVR